jgi:hypothetical protein
MLKNSTLLMTGRVGSEFREPATYRLGPQRVEKKHNESN